jgi:hypothetical protein
MCRIEEDARRRVDMIMKIDFNGELCDEVYEKKREVHVKGGRYNLLLKNRLKIE